MAVVASSMGILAAPCVAVAAAGFGPLSGSGGCVAGPEDSSGRAAGCGEGKGLVSPRAVAVSPDGANVYVASGTTGSSAATSFGSLAILTRDPTTGAITETGCLSSDGTDGRDGASGACTPDPLLLGADGVTVSPDGSTVYVSSGFSGSVLAFVRNTSTGSLTQLGCLGPPCAFAKLFPDSGALVASLDGKALYVAAPAQGSISALLGPVTTPASAGEATAVNGSLSSVSSLFSDQAQAAGDPCIAVNGLDGSCEVGVAMQGLDSLTSSPNGKQLYGTAPKSNAIDVFSTEETGTLPESSCVKVDAPHGLCTDATLMNSPTALAVSPDERNVYAADSSQRGGQVDVFTRNQANGALSQTSCVDFLPEPRHAEGDKEEQEEEGEEQEGQQEATAGGACAGVPGLSDVKAVAVSGDGSEVYAIGDGSLVIFARDASTGALEEISCASEEDSRCTSLPSLDDVEAAAVSPDGRDVYVVAGNAVTVLTQGASVLSGEASATRAGAAELSVQCPRSLRTRCSGHLELTAHVRGGHPRGKTRTHGRRVRVGRSASYSMTPGSHGSVSVLLTRAGRRLLADRQRLRLMAVVRADAAAGGSGDGRRLVLHLAR
jgi:DNA-binding beta-propeller fold protein YncE